MTSHCAASKRQHCDGITLTSCTRARARARPDVTHRQVVLIVTEQRREVAAAEDGLAVELEDAQVTAERQQVCARTPIQNKTIVCLLALHVYKNIRQYERTTLYNY